MFYMKPNSPYKCLFFFLFLLLAPNFCYGKPLEIDNPVKAIVMYFPSPAVMRCLNHSEVPQKFRKAIISRQAKFPDKTEVVQNITIGTTGKKFVFNGNTIDKDEIKILEIKEGPYFGKNNGGKVKSSFLFGLESLIGLQKCVEIKDRIGDQNLNFETFLKTTKGMIGSANYNLELTGQDRSINGKLKYFLNGAGRIGDYKITVSAEDLQKDYYEISEHYGPVEVFTTVRVYD